MPFLVLFRMPLFFFVSGFLAYKASQVWNIQNLGSLLLKKFKVQVIPTVVFFFLAMAILNKDFWPAVEKAYHSVFKGGYWFTIVLLYMFILYYLFCYLESKLKVKSWIPITVLFIISMCFYDTFYQPRYFSWALGYRRAATPLKQFLDDTSLLNLMLYFPFFLYGDSVCSDNRSDQTESSFCPYGTASTEDAKVYTAILAMLFEIWVFTKVMVFAMLQHKDTILFQ